MNPIAAVRSQHGNVLAHTAPIVEEEVNLPVVVEQIRALLRNLFAREVVRLELDVGGEAYGGGAVLWNPLAA